MKYNKKIIADSIRQKGYKNIPDWIMNEIDDELFRCILFKAKDDFSQYGIDILNFFYLLSKKRKFDLYNLNTLWSSTLFYEIYSVMINKDWEWFSLLKVTDKKPFGANENIIKLYVSMMYHQYEFYGSIPKPLIVGILRNMETDNYYNSKKYIDTFMIDIINIKSVDFIHLVFDSIKGFDSKFYWIDTVFSFDNIWGYGIPYYPDTLGIDTLYSFLYYMSCNVQSMTVIDLPDNILDLMSGIISDNEYSIEDKKSIYQFMITLTEYNINNIRFLGIFKDIILPSEFNEDIIRLVRHNLFGNHTRNILKNYSWLKNIFLLYNNDDFQLAYIKKGGNLDDLLCDSTSVIFTTDGVVTALNHSNFSEIIKLISNSSTFDILVDGIIGKKEFYPTIERLASAIVNEENRTDAMKSISRMINIYYSLPDIIMNSTTVKPFYSIIEAPRPTIYKIVSKLPMSVTEIPFNMITYDQFIDIVKHFKTYVPINTRDDNSELVGIDKYLSIADIVKLIRYGSEGYLCNINSPSVGFTVLNILELDV